MLILKAFSSFVLGGSFVLISLSTLLLAQEPVLHFLSLPNELREIPSVSDRIFEDINQDGRLDLLFIEKDNLYLSYQKPDSSFSDFEILNIPMNGAVDFADIFPGGEKEILIMHSQGISSFQKDNSGWRMTPDLIVEAPTAYEQNAHFGLTREHFAIDFDDDGIPELFLWGQQAYSFYRKDSSGTFQLIQTFPSELHTYLIVPGMNIYRSPLARFIGGNGRYLFHNKWPLSVWHLNWQKESAAATFLIGDLNQDSKKDFAWIRTKEGKSTEKGISKVYEYEIHFFDNKNNTFALEPGRVIYDPHGAWLSPTCKDIDGDGNIELLKYQIKSKGDLIQRASLQLELFQMENDYYPENPSQILETSGFPLGVDPLVDVNGDGIQDLILIHPETKGFTLGSIIRKYIEKNVDAEVRILLYRRGQGFSQEGMIRKKVYVSFILGIPISLSGDFNGDGLKDLLLMRGDRIEIYPLLRGKTGFSRFPWVNIKIPSHGMNEVIDVDGDLKSEIVIYYPDRIGILCINRVPKS